MNRREPSWEGLGFVVFAGITVAVVWLAIALVIGDPIDPCNLPAVESPGETLRTAQGAVVECEARTR